MNRVQINIRHISNSLQSAAEVVDNECVLTRIHTSEWFSPRAFGNLNEEVVAMDSWIDWGLNFASWCNRKIKEQGSWGCL